MPTVHFTPNLRRHVSCPSCQAPGQTVAQVLSNVFAQNPSLRTYILDDQNAVRPHISIFLNSEQIRDRKQLTDPVSPTDQLHIMQALSGG